MIYITVFLLPQHVQKYSLDPEKTEAGEYWRFATFQFDHLNIAHLLENMAGLVFLIMLAYELRTRVKEFMFVYLTAGMLSILPLWIIMRFTALGASNAIYGGLGLLILGLSVIFSRTWLILSIVVVALFSNTIYIVITSGTYAADTIIQDIGHFSGFLYGLILFYTIRTVRYISEKNKRMCLRRFGSDD